MLAEILMVRLETALRAAQEPPPARDPRFIPFTLAARSQFKAAAPTLLAPETLAAVTKANP
jgi:hypothetical protein